VDNVKERGHLKDLGVDKRSKAIAAVELSSFFFGVIMLREVL
jgi:hypothetical protein